MALEGAKVGPNSNPPLPPLLYKTVRVPNANVRALFSTPFTLIPAQGLNKYIMPEYMHVHKPAGTAFTGGTLIQITWVGIAVLLSISVVGFLDQTAKKSILGTKPNVSSYLVSPAVNLDLSLAVTGSNPATSLDTDLFLGITFRVWEDNPSPWM